MKVYTRNMINKKVVLKYGIENDFPEFTIKEEVEDSVLGDHEVRIKINSCALSRIEHKFLKKFCNVDYPNESYPVGREISGIIETVGDKVELFKAEDEVVGFIPIHSCYSGCATYCVLSQFDIVLKPDKVSHVDAACGIGDAIKAYTALFYQAKISSGETVVIVDATTGFGIVCNQLAQYWGAKVIVTGSTDEEITFLKTLDPPASKVIDLRNKRRNLVSVCLEETGGLGVDCFLDNKVEMYTDEYADTLPSKQQTRLLINKHDVLSSLGVGGRWVTMQNNLQIDPPDSELLTLKCASIHYLFEHSWTLSRCAQGRYLHILNDVMRKMTDGVLRPTVHHTVLFDDVISALTEIDTAAHTIGKVVVKI